MSKPEAYPAGMSAQRFKELTTPFELTRFGKKIPIPALYTPEVLMNMLLEKEAKGEVLEKPSPLQDTFAPDEYSELRERAMYPVQRDSTGRPRCSFCGHYKDHPDNSVAPEDSGK